MTLCTLCGTIHNSEDKHQCDPTLIPQKGQENKPTSSMITK